MPTDDENALYAQLAAWRAEEDATTQHLLKEIADHGEANTLALLKDLAAMPCWQDAPADRGAESGIPTDSKTKG